MMLAQSTSEIESLSALLTRHGATAFFLAVVLGSFLWGVHYLLTTGLPKLIEGIRTDHAATLSLFRVEQDKDRSLYRETIASIVARLDQMCVRLESLEREVRSHGS